MRRRAGRRPLGDDPLVRQPAAGSGGGAGQWIAGDDVLRLGGLLRQDAPNPLGPLGRVDGLLLFCSLLCIYIYIYAYM